jgi:hypothetical protein
MSAIKNISLFIPHVFPNFDKEYVAKAFKDIGEISQIDFVAKQDRSGGNYNAVYVHFNKWYTNEKAIAFYHSVVDESKETRFHHDELWYWIVLPNNAKKHIPGQRKPRIDLGESKSISSSNLDVSPKPAKTPRPAKSLLPLLAFIPGKVCPGAPQKRSYADATVKPVEKPVEKPVIEEVKQSLEVSFDEVADFEPEIDAEMDEIEEFLEEEDANLVSVDWRYVKSLEDENGLLHGEIAQLRAALINLDQMYQAEAAKVRAFKITSVDL